MAMELKTKNQKLAPLANCFPHSWRAKYRSGFTTLPTVPLQEQPVVVLLLEGTLVSWSLAMDERG
jgi:hypothetical protein